MKETKNKKKKAYHSRYTFCRRHLDKQIHTVQRHPIISQVLVQRPVRNTTHCKSQNLTSSRAATTAHRQSRGQPGPAANPRHRASPCAPRSGQVLRSETGTWAHEHRGPCRGWAWNQMSLVHTSGRPRAAALLQPHNHVACRTQQGGSRTQAETQHSFKNIQDPKKVFGGNFF